MAVCVGGAATSTLSLATSLSRVRASVQFVGMPRLAVILCAVLGFSCAYYAPATVDMKDLRDDKWDYFLFVEQYPAGVCYYGDPSSKGCYYPSNATEWTMHGLWPTADGSEGPNYCDPDATFDLGAVEDLIPRLVAEWTNLEPKTTLGSFWSHEWLKHGTCASGIPSLSSEHGFFSTVLGLFEKGLNFGQVLKDYGVIPSNSTTYQLNNFTQAFVNKLHVKPFIECLYSEDKGQVLSQITICMQKDFTMMECPSDVYTRSGCWDNQTIHYVQSMYASL